jgi:hypothetical protein
MAMMNQGTDEFTYGDQPRGNSTGDNNQHQELGSYNINPTNGALGSTWNRNYSNINLCNMVVEYAPGIAMSEGTRNSILGEARYLRAQYYLLLVQQFGAVPLNLGSGELKFNTLPTQEFNRLPTAELLVKNYQAMIDDLVFASNNLRDQRPGNEFRLSKAAALHLLAKVYLFRAYSAAKQPTDFKNAYDAAKKLIDNKALYGVDLLTDFADVHRQKNDYNKEILFSVERLPMSNVNNEIGDPGTQFDEKVNIAANLYTADYVSVKVNNASPIPARVLQYNRPLRRFAPNRWVLDVAFADKVNDSRFENTFRVMWRASAVVTTPAGTINIGDTAFVIAPSDRVADSLNALTGVNAKKYRVIAPRECHSITNPSSVIYPTLSKYDDSSRANFNDVSGRPYIVSKFSEVYLLAAEAALGDNRPADALPLINVLRERAAYRTGLDNATLTTRKAAMQLTSASQITLDFILDERTRELCGESVRWPDLAIRGKLYDRIKAYNPDGATKIMPFHVLRPIPQGQLDAIADPDKKKYQNTGY